MNVSIGALNIGGNVLENVTLTDVSPDEFLKLVGNKTKNEISEPVKNKDIKPAKQAMNKSAHNRKVKATADTTKINIPKDCVLGIAGIMEHTGFNKHDARLLQVAGLPVIKTIECDKAISPKGVVNLYKKSDIDALVKKRQANKAGNPKNMKNVKSETKFSQPQPVKITDKDTGEVYTFDSITIAAKRLMINQSSLWRALNKGDGIYKNYHIQHLTEPVEPVKKEVPPVMKWLTYNEFYGSIHNIIKKANKDMGKTLSEAYKDVTNVWGINWMQAKKDYTQAVGDVPANTLRIAYWIENNGIYGTPKGTLKASVERVLAKDQPLKFSVSKRV